MAEDEKEFIDMGSQIQLLVEEHVIKDGKISGAGVKNIEIVRRKSGMQVEAFQKHWPESFFGKSQNPLTLAVLCSQHTFRLWNHLKKHTSDFDPDFAPWIPKVSPSTIWVPFQSLMQPPKPPPKK